VLDAVLEADPLGIVQVEQPPGDPVRVYRGFSSTDVRRTATREVAGAGIRINLGGKHEPSGQTAARADRLPDEAFRSPAAVLVRCVEEVDGPSIAASTVATALAGSTL